jgi:hypothetical protein
VDINYGRRELRWRKAGEYIISQGNSNITQELLPAFKNYTK